MAANVEKSAHAVENLKSSNRPSIFELLAQQNLLNGIKPAVQHLSRVLSSTFAGRYGTSFCKQYLDEIYALLELVLQNYYLKNYGASFSENFYGLKRVVVSSNEMISTVGERWQSLMFLVIVPYLKNKLDKLFTRMKDTLPSLKKRNKIHHLQAAFVAVYPIIKASLEMWVLALQLGYLISKTETHHPWILLSGVRLESLSTADLSRMYPQRDWTPPVDAGILRRLSYRSQQAVSSMFHGASKLLGLMLFFLQFLDYWYSQESSHKAIATMTTLPTSRAPQEIYTNDKILKIDPGHCPICRKQRKNDTVVAVSGYVYCYGCIHSHLEKQPYDPVTKLPANHKHLIRLFIDAA